MAQEMLQAICLLLLAALQSANSQQEPSCSFKYLQQPPSSTISNCSPYTDSQDINISLECLVRRAKGINHSLRIKWFRENINGTVEDLGFVHETGNGIDFISRYHDKKLLHQHYNPSLLGRYWCQVVNTSANPDKLLKKSNVFTLLAPYQYRGTTCYGTSVVQVIHNETCADLRTNPPSDHHITPTATSVITASLPEVSHDRHTSIITTTPNGITTIQLPIATSSNDLTPFSTACINYRPTAVSPTLSHQTSTTTKLKSHSILSKDQQTSTKQVTIRPTATPNQDVPTTNRPIRTFPSNVPHTPTTPTNKTVPCGSASNSSTLLHSTPQQNTLGLLDRTAAPTTPSNTPPVTFAVPIVVLITTVFLIITAAISAACITIVTAVTCGKCFKKRHSKVVFQRTEPKQVNNISLSYIRDEREPSSPVPYEINPNPPEPYYCHLERGYHCTTPVSFVMQSETSLEQLSPFDRTAIPDQLSFDRSTTLNRSATDQSSFDRSTTSNRSAMLNRLTAYESLDRSYNRSTISDRSTTFSHSTTLERSMTIDQSPTFDRPLRITQAPTHDHSPTINITLMEPYYQKLFSVDYANVYDSISPTPPPASPKVPPRKPGHHYSKPNLQTAT